MASIVSYKDETASNGREDELLDFPFLQRMVYIFTVNKYFSEGNGF
jgi:hypothetical protein